MNISRIIIADNQPLTALAVEALCKRLTTNGHNQEAEIVYATNKYELGVLLKQRVNCAVIIDYTLFNFDNQDNFAMMCDLYQETSSWLLLSDELTADFLRFVLYQTTNVSVSYKDSPIDIIREALRFVLRGERYIAQHAMNILLLSEMEQPHVNTDLTQTELEILKAMTQGKLTKEIAYERGSIIHTINSHRKNIFRKLNVNCAHDAIKYALRAGLVDQAEFYI
jgi:DNA-binding NarL/FixJ family response regulator